MATVSAAGFGLPARHLMSGGAPHISAQAAHWLAIGHEVAPGAVADALEACHHVRESGAGMSNAVSLKPNVSNKLLRIAFFRRGFEEPVASHGFVV